MTPCPELASATDPCFSDAQSVIYSSLRGFAGRPFDRVYANGDNTLALKTGEGGPKVHLIEEKFRRLMFETEGV